MKGLLLLILTLPVVLLAQRNPHQASVLESVLVTLRPVIEKNAGWAMQQEPVTVTASSSARSAGGLHDFFSEGDYWWPDPKSPDSPYVQRDGLTNPDNFNDHRNVMIRFSRIAGALGSAFVLTKKPEYARQLMLHCRAWFVDTATRMNPRLLYAQAIKGRATGRGIGIIDAIQLMEVVKALEVVEPAVKDKKLYKACRAWFSDYLAWVSTHPYGLDEKNAKNNHGTCWVMQVAVFAGFTGNKPLLDTCARRFREVLLPAQLAADGSFPLELKRTKPYGYSLFNLDAMTTIAHELWGNAGDLWQAATAQEATLFTAVDFMLPYINDKNSWPYGKDVMYWDEWPVAQPFLVFATVASGKKEYLDTWKKLDHDPQVGEVIRNLPVRNPLIWLYGKK
ncbi:MAG: alginate lyase [Chitinophagaceae bacterium]|nr:MAG: alginate lyase [Chitinophagaceae bacterium]